MARQARAPRNLRRRALLRTHHQRRREHPPQPRRTLLWSTGRTREGQHKKRGGWIRSVQPGAQAASRTASPSAIAGEPATAARLFGARATWVRPRARQKTLNRKMPTDKSPAKRPLRAFGADPLLTCDSAQTTRNADLQVF